MALEPVKRLPVGDGDLIRREMIAIKLHFLLLLCACWRGFCCPPALCKTGCPVLVFYVTIYNLHHFYLKSSKNSKNKHKKVIYFALLQ
jgi:hypothetical protein